MPLNLLFEHLLDVTATSTIDGVVEGVFAIRKSLTAVVEFLVSVKKAVCEFSGLAFTVIVTPPAGSVEVIVTFKGKPGPGAGGSVEFIAGEVVICNDGSDEHESDDFFVQCEKTERLIRARIIMKFLLINRS